MGGKYFENENMFYLWRRRKTVKEKGEKIF